jgi:hypothetical protein
MFSTDGPEMKPFLAFKCNFNYSFSRAFAYAYPLKEYFIPGKPTVMQRIL